MLTGILEIDTQSYWDLIQHNIKSGGNLLVLGQAGIGKTEIPFQVAKKNNLKTVYWNLSTQEPPDLTGLPIISDVDGIPCVEYASPHYLPVYSLNPEPVMVVIDELDKVKPDMQNPLLEILHLRTLNGRRLNIKSIVATGNLPDEGAFSKPISHALTNRCSVYKLRHNHDGWLNWAVDSGVNGLIVAFINRNPEYLSRPPVVGDPTAYARCSPRSWNNAARELDVSIKSGDDIEFQTTVVAGKVGMEPAAKFRVWLEHYRHVEPIIDKIVDGKNVSIGNMSIDRVLVTSIGSCSKLSSMMESKEKKDKVHKVASNVFKFLIKLPPEIQVAAVKSTLSMTKIREYSLTGIGEVAEVFSNIVKALE
jgi:hypothetical protein